MRALTLILILMCVSKGKALYEGMYCGKENCYDGKGVSFVSEFSTNLA